jgi:hypothetical protein
MRQFADADGLEWIAEVVSLGRTSAYLNPKVHRPIVQFTCQSRALPRRYASLPGERDSLEVLNDVELNHLLATATVH